ncbi:NUDIX hydrolase [Entomohabitans teleogrylli]|uniref:NUDIX hydrolase n=1 Tax=Entomohabitans teleogrylli TaxID=1384589 RepID=UPI00073DA332|nr:NUDIX domain-containing protein [Entomohabitans teleogrylli]
MAADRQIHIAAAVIRDDAGRCLLVRKRNTRYFMQPGGKIDVGESPQGALVRELREELSICVDPQALRSLGRFIDIAANEPQHQLVAEMFTVSGTFQVTPAAEIEEVVWLDPDSRADILLAPLTEKQILPLLRA